MLGCWDNGIMGCWDNGDVEMGCRTRAEASTRVWCIRVHLPSVPDGASVTMPNGASDGVVPGLPQPMCRWTELCQHVIPPEWPLTMCHVTSLFYRHLAFTSFKVQPDMYHWTAAFFKIVSRVTRR
jgi:hypothetical protein